MTPEARACARTRLERARLHGEAQEWICNDLQAALDALDATRKFTFTQREELVLAFDVNHIHAFVHALCEVVDAGMKSLSEKAAKDREEEAR